MTNIKLKGSKIVEVPYFSSRLHGSDKSILIIGERWGAEGISETIHSQGYVSNVTTTDILPMESHSWIKQNTNWKHIQIDFIEFDESLKYDYIIAISVFEHFGFWFAGDRMANGLIEDDICRWNHDIKGINKACKLLKDKDSKLLITLPAGPYMNYENTGEPFLRSYDLRRQNIIKNQLNGYKLIDEHFYYSENFVNWDEVTSDINDFSYYPYYNIHSPNVIWCFTIQKN